MPNVILRYMAHLDSSNNLFLIVKKLIVKTAKVTQSAVYSPAMLYKVKHFCIFSPATLWKAWHSNVLSLSTYFKPDAESSLEVECLASVFIIYKAFLWRKKVFWMQNRQKGAVIHIFFSIWKKHTKIRKNLFRETNQVTFLSSNKRSWIILSHSIVVDVFFFCY